MNKDNLIGIFRTVKNNFRLIYVLMVQTSQEDIMENFIKTYASLDEKLKVFDGIEPLILDEKVLKIAVEQLYISIQRNAIKELFEVVNDYCGNTGQIELLKSQDWYQLWRIIRNSFSHDFHFRFNSYDKKHLPINWRGIEIREDMDGEIVKLKHFSYNDIWVLINSAEDFAVNKLT